MEQENEYAVISFLDTIAGEEKRENVFFVYLQLAGEKEIKKEVFENVH